jgi:hypothetical protein
LIDAYLVNPERRVQVVWVAGFEVEDAIENSVLAA